MTKLSLSCTRPSVKKPVNAPIGPARSLPAALKTEAEQKSGLDMDGVTVHHNSPEPAKLNALAFTALRNIYLGPGQEKLLPHESWHVVQQMQGRVSPTGKRAGQGVNEDPALEREAETWTNRDMQSGQGSHGEVENSAGTGIAPIEEPISPVIQGYFSAPIQSGSIFSSFGKRPPASKENIEEIVKYINRDAQFLYVDFDSKRKSKDDEGLLTDWVQNNLFATLDEIRLSNIRAQYPQIEEIPDTWITDTHAINDGGPPIIVSPSPQSSPRHDDYSDSEDPSLVQDVLFTDYVIDISQDQFSYRGSFYPISDNDRKDIRASAILDNTFLDFLDAPLTAQSPGEIKVPGTSFSKGPRKGQQKSISDVGDDLLRKERARPSKRDRNDYEGKVLSHHPDRALWPYPSSSLGFHPQSSTANTLEGDASGLSQRIGNKRPVRRVVVKEKSGKHHEYNVKNRRSRRLDRAGKLTRIQLSSYQDTLNKIQHDNEDISQVAQEAIDMMQDIVSTARQQLRAGEPFSLASYIEQYVKPLLEKEDNSIMDDLQELVDTVLEDTPEIPLLYKL